MVTVIAVLAFLNVVILDVVLAISVKRVLTARAEMRKSMQRFGGMFQRTTSEAPSRIRNYSDEEAANIIRGEK